MAEMMTCLQCSKRTSLTASGKCRPCRRQKCKDCGVQFTPTRRARVEFKCSQCYGDSIRRTGTRWGAEKQIYGGGV